MSIFVDSFDHYASANVGLKYTSENSSEIAAGLGRFGTAALLLNAGGRHVTKVLDAQNTWRVGFAWQCAPTTTKRLCNFLDGSTSHVYLETDASGHISVYRGDGTLLGTGTTVLSSSTYYYVEVYVTIHDSTGAVTVRINGADELVLTSKDTRNGGNATADTFQLGPGATSMYFDDLYVLNGSDASAFWGDVRIQYIAPTAEGNSSAWTPLSGTDNALMIDDTAPNGDTDYNRSSTAGQKDTYVFGNLTPTAGAIKALQWIADARKDDAGTRTFCPVYRHGSTDYDGTTQALGATYIYYRETSLLNPGTGVAWTIADVNAAEFGVKVVA